MAGRRRAERPERLWCPICRKEVPGSGAFFPFCSERCQLVDLGRWLDGRYRIEVPVEATDREVAQESPDREPPETEGTKS